MKYFLRNNSRNGNDESVYYKHKMKEVNPSVNSIQDYYKITMSKKEFLQLSNFIQKEAGIKMPEVKKTMLQSRLQKRLRQLQITSFEEYIEFAFKKGNESEVLHMIDVVSTNKTDFYREPLHFKYMTDDLLPNLIKKLNHKTIKVWSAGCSSGEEVYTIAITMQEFINLHPEYDYHILGTDISNDILNKAMAGIYKLEKTDPIPMEVKKKYFLKSKNKISPTVKVMSSLTNKTAFRRLNFMDDHYQINDMFDIVFCRNVLIYFERENQEKVINKICSHLRTGGIFFLGHSESIMNMDVPLKQIRPTVFEKI